KLRRTLPALAAGSRDGDRTGCRGGARGKYWYFRCDRSAWPDHRRVTARPRRGIGRAVAAPDQPAALCPTRRRPRSRSAPARTCGCGARTIASIKENLNRTGIQLAVQLKRAKGRADIDETMGFGEGKNPDGVAGRGNSFNCYRFAIWRH